MAKKKKKKLDEGVVLGAAKRDLDGPFSIRDLQQVLSVPKKRRSELNHIVQALVSQEKLEKIKGRARYALPREDERVRGRIQGHRDGFAFLIPEDPEQQDVYLAQQARDGAMHGDQVIVEISPRSRPNRPEGRVVRILERAHQRVVGRFVQEDGGGRIEPFERKLAWPVRVRRAGDANTGMFVEAEITRHPKGRREAEAKIVEVLGYPDEAGVDAEVVLRHYGITSEHSDAAMREAEKAPDRVTKAARKGRQDLRQMDTVTIDGETARDFDDAVSLKRTRNGYRLWVHIADVAEYVRRGTAIDAEAWERGTSVYLPDRAVHMLPEPLSAGICSLKPGEDRLVVTVEMQLDRDGGLRQTRVYESVIRSDERMTYTKVKRLLEEEDDALQRRYQSLLPTFHLMEEVAGRLIERRRERGSIDFDLPEPILVMDEKGVLTEILPSERNVAHRIIEEFMILANRAVAQHLGRHHLPGIYRIHEEPDPAKIRDLAEFGAGFGLTLSHDDGRIEPGDLADLIDQAQGGPEERLVSELSLRSMSRARYDPEPVGHFGLALDDYLHFTSPIRRYPDLVVHRILKEWVRAGDQGSGRASWEEKGFDDYLQETCDHCSQRERQAEKAERTLVEWKQVAFMARHVGDIFDGRITGVMPFGIFVELERFFVEGLVHVSRIEDDHYEYDESKHRLLGQRTGNVLRLGDGVKIRVAKADLENRRLDFDLVQQTGRAKKKRRRKGRRRGKGRKGKKGKG